MRCLCSMESPARPFHLGVPKHALGAPSSLSLPRRRRPQSLLNDDDDVSVSTGQQVGELGQTLLATIQSKQAAPIRKSKEQVSGSDVLWALQKAGARKNKNKNKKKRVSSSAGTPRDREEAVDYSKVRPLSINPNWPAKLDDLEKRLRELQNSNLTRE